jgi:hypothetical protein
MTEEELQLKQRQNESNQREMYRKSRDTIRVFNPLSEPFRFLYDSYPQTVPAKSYKDMERYLANLYFRKISEKIINDMIAAKTEQIVDKKKATGNSWIDKYAENREIMTQVPRTDDPTLLKKIHEDVIIGLVEQYGMEEPINMPSQPQADRRDVFEQIMATDKRVTGDLPAPEIKEIKTLKGTKPSADDITA